MGNGMKEHGVDPFEVVKLYKYLRIADVSDAMDGIGHFDMGLMSPEIRPLWSDMKFWGVALTLRCVPANRPMWKLNTTEEIVRDNALWFEQMPNMRVGQMIKPGNVVVSDTGGARETGMWGSANGLGLMTAGAVGIVTNGYVRDTAECILEKLPICARSRGRTIEPGRLEQVEVQTKIGCGGVQVGPGDIVGCDDDGVIVVPLAIAEEIAVHARGVLLADMRARRKLYERAGMAPDATVDYEMVEAYYSQF
jgi:4-hydroxy-4-methyl-2-oxoglutarate aldolase